MLIASLRDGLQFCNLRKLGMKLGSKQLGTQSHRQADYQLAIRCVVAAYKTTFPKILGESYILCIYYFSINYLTLVLYAHFGYNFVCHPTRTADL